jgi:hypothetical protein
MFGWKNLKTFSIKSEAENIAKVLEIQGITSKITDEKENELVNISLAGNIKLWVKNEDSAEALDVLTHTEIAA